MSVLIAMPWDQRAGGVTHVASSLARFLDTQGHKPTFLFPTENGLKIRTGISLRGFPSIYCRLRDFPPDRRSWRGRISWYSTVLTALPQLIVCCLVRRVDLINVHYPTSGFALLVNLARWLRVPLIVSAHGSDLLPDSGPERGRGLLRLLESADAVVVPSQNYLRSVVDAFPQLVEKIRCIYNGYDEEELAAVDAMHSRKSDSDVTALCIAALIPKKGVDVLLHALKQCTSSQLRLRLIGEGPLRHELESLSATLGLSNRVSFLGPKDRNEVFGEIFRCDLLVMPSRHQSESFGLAVLEAMACGKPVVASAVGGLPELVGDRETGLLVSPEDPLALAQALDVLAEDSALREMLGTAGRAKAMRFTARLSAEAYEALFIALVGRATRPAQSEAI